MDKMHKVCSKFGYTLYKSRREDKAKIVKDKIVVFKSTHYLTNQEFLKLTSN